MNNTQFHQIADQQMHMIEQAIEDSQADIDCDMAGNILTLEFADRSQIIINRQEALQEIWLASKRGGYHFQYKQNDWICSRTHTSLSTVIQQECDYHAKENLSLNLNNSSIE